jgi:hypothetical protein
LPTESPEEATEEASGDEAAEAERSAEDLDEEERSVMSPKRRGEHFGKEMARLTDEASHGKRR